MEGVRGFAAEIYLAGNGSRPQERLPCQKQPVAGSLDDDDSEDASFDFAFLMMMEEASKVKPPTPRKCHQLDHLGSLSASHRQTRQISISLSAFVPCWRMCEMINLCRAPAISSGAQAKVYDCVAEILRVVDVRFF